MEPSCRIEHSQQFKDFSAEVHIPNKNETFNQFEKKSNNFPEKVTFRGNKIFKKTDEFNYKNSYPSYDSKLFSTSNLKTTSPASQLDESFNENFDSRYSEIVGKKENTFSIKKDKENKRTFYDLSYRNPKQINVMSYSFLYNLCKIYVSKL